MRLYHFKIKLIILRLVLLFVFIGFSLFGNAQTKKEQIQILNKRVDSLKTVKSSEKLNFETRKKELESSISKSNQKTNELLKTLSTKKENLQDQISENKKLEKDILSLKLELKTIQDSIQRIIDDQPIELLESSLINKSDEEIIQFFNINVEESTSDLDYGLVRGYFIDLGGKQVFSLGGKKYCSLMLTITFPSFPVGFPGTTILGLLVENNGSWDLIKKTDVFFGGQAGNPSVLEKFCLVGEKCLAVVLNNFTQGQGAFYEQRKIFSLINNDFVQVYEGIKSGYDLVSTWSQNVDDEYDIEFKKSTSSKYFDLIETKKSHGKKAKTTILKFNENLMKYE
jgi:hypothetical protein